MRITKYIYIQTPKHTCSWSIISQLKYQEEPLPILLYWEFKKTLWKDDENKQKYIELNVVSIISYHFSFSKIISFKFSGIFTAPIGKSFQHTKLNRIERKWTNKCSNFLYFWTTFTTRMTQLKIKIFELFSIINKKKRWIGIISFQRKHMLACLSSQVPL